MASWYDLVLLVGSFYAFEVTRNEMSLEFCLLIDIIFQFHFVSLLSFFLSSQISQLTDDTLQPDLTKYKYGQEKECRVMGFNFIEGLVLVTLKE